MERPRRTVLIDATPLRTPSGVRGIGRYVFELLHGLGAIRSSWADRFRLVALGSLGSFGECEMSEDLGSIAEAAKSERGAIPNAMVRRRRQLWLGRACKEAGADLVHQTEALGTPLGLSVPRLVTCYDLIPLRYPEHYLTTRLHYPLQWLKDYRRYARAHRVVTISQRSRDDVLRILGLRPERVQAVVTGIDLGRWASQSGQGDRAELSRLGLAHRNYIVYVGYGDYRKNVEGMFATLARVRRETDLDLVWAGALDTKRLREAERKAKHAGVERNVRFLGFVSDETLAALFRCSVAHLFLSRLEGFGLSVAEAMAVRCPVVVARGSGADEVAGDAGIVVDPDDPDAAAAAILELLRDPSWRAQCGAACQRSVALFDRESMAAGYVNEYARVLEAQHDGQEARVSAENGAVSA